ncbi:hypothetical protein H072_98 [Dactylellina haptotyla CBS 200.50]|uniref:Protein kinase domain-containing protein n=1 Tax=Dactylellina haptotyla (strain CBS 200.50) TaxID=1284197 RepID=S8CE32_DACHA|nr:hypothetical protein H072_98 [Dactylellina haptotyla CBS 200.50]
MSDLYERVQSLLYQCESDGNVDPDEVRKFIPIQLLYNLLTEEEISKVVDRLFELERIPFYHKRDILNWIIPKGIRIFGILILLRDQEHLISKFMENDNFQGSGIDDKLPLTKELLERIVTDIADQFYDTQWAFIAPVWSKNVIHRELPPEIIFPFTFNKQIDAGGFGDIFEIRLHPDHQTVPLLQGANDQWMVRKEFKSVLFGRRGIPGSRSETAVEDQNDYKKELRNLSILNELKHPNIIELLTSYTHKGKHNLIFPFIPGGNLATFFRSEERPQAFQNDETFLTAICDLSSAIEKVHHYTLERLNIEMMGCHYDLKPKNILVRDDTFVLADFGLSKIRGSATAAKDIYQGGSGDYLAPECEDFSEGFAKNPVSQSSDIWSFGGILSEILTYMRMGERGVQEYKSKRRVKIGNSRMSAFHAGIGRVNPGVQEWLLELDSGHIKYSRELIQLIRSMLDLDPDARPNARQVTLSLRKIATRFYYSLVYDLYQNIVDKLPDSFEGYAEFMRIKSWGFLLGHNQSNGDAKKPIDTDTNYKLNLVAICSCLKNIYNELKATIPRLEGALSPLFSSLRILSDELVDLLPPELETRANAHWEIEMVSSEDIEELLKTSEEPGRTSNRISTLARIKRMSIIAAAQEKSGYEAHHLKVDSSLIKLVSKLGDHKQAAIRLERYSGMPSVLVEEIRYGNLETIFLEKLLARIEALALLLNSMKPPPDFRILKCSGFFHTAGNNSLGLIFDFPNHLDTVPRTLEDVIAKSSKLREQPTLGSRFQLALTLALSLSGFHKVGWLHKSISAHNVLLFIPNEKAKSQSAADWLVNPYLIGFNHSRQDDPFAFTIGQDDNKNITQYYHPEYARKAKVVQEVTHKLGIDYDTHTKFYKLRYDYFSLGLVLLEIGLWGTLGTLTRNEAFPSNAESLKYLQSKRVPMLGHYMGSGYRAAVETCLSGFDNDEGGEQVRNLQLKFEEQVIQRLRRCHA